MVELLNEYIGFLITVEKTSETSHIIWMLEEMKNMNTYSGKFNRWLGFVQGFLWLKGYYTIDELRTQIRKIT